MPILKREKGEARAMVPALAAVLVGAWAAYATAMGVLGVQQAESHLIRCLAGLVSDWSVWPGAGARLPECRLDAAAGLMLCWVWSAVIWMAGRTVGRGRRSLWLLAALFFALASTGAGNVAIPVVVTLTVAFLDFLVPKAMVCGALGRGAVVTRYKATITAGVLAACSYGFMVVAWGDVSDAETTPSVTSIVYYWMMVLIVAVISVLLLRKTTATWLKVGLIGVVLPTVLLPGPGWDSVAGWKACALSFARMVEFPSSRDLRRRLSDYRAIDRVAAAERHSSAEATTRWGELRSLVAQAELVNRRVAIWLQADAEAFASSEFKISNRAALIKRLAKSTEAWQVESAGWLALQSNTCEDARIYFLGCLNQEPGNSMAWYGLALAEARLGNRDAYVTRALTVACILDPRLLTSPVLDRPLFRRVSAQVRSFAEGAEARGCMTDQDIACLKRYSAWGRVWADASGDLACFLNQTTPLSDAAVVTVRQRFLSTLASPDDSRIEALFGAGGALLTDRHFNVGQAHRLFKLAQSGREAVEPTEYSLKSRPWMVGWCSSITEGGVGKSLGIFEENLFIRLTCYGWARPVCRPDLKWLCRQVEEAALFNKSAAE